MSLFRLGHVTLNSGLVSNFKVECDALDLGDWQTLAQLVRERIPDFGGVIGIPSGGLPLQAALEPFATANPTDCLLIVDDVYTTGKNMRQAHWDWSHRWKGPTIGVAAFARGAILEPWVQAIWSLTLK
jgi:orotate phosphoribosyltransferase